MGYREMVPYAAGQLLCSSSLAPQTEYVAVKIASGSQRCGSMRNAGFGV